MNINKNYITLKFFNFRCSPEVLTKELGLTPTKTGIKGQSYWQGAKDSKIKKIWPHNYWEYRVTKKGNNWISGQVDQFIDEIIIPKKAILKKIISTCEAEFSIVQYYYSGCNPGLHFDNKRLQVISEIGAEIDIDIYCLSEEE